MRFFLFLLLLPITTFADCYPWNISLDLLYWQTNRSYLELSVDATGNTFVGEVFVLDPDWDLDYRVGLGRYVCGDCWKIFATYTDICQKTCASREVPDPVRLIPQRVSNTNLNDIDAVQACYDMVYRTFDLGISYDFEFPSLCMQLTPFAAAKFIYLYEKLFALYSGDVGSNPRLPETGLQRNLSNSYGMVVGSDICWSLVPCFLISGSTSAGVVHCFCNQKWVVTDAISGAVVNTTGKNCVIVPFFSLETGLSFLACRNRCASILFHVGYEFQLLEIPDWLFAASQSGSAIFQNDLALFSVNGLVARMEIRF